MERIHGSNITFSLHHVEVECRDKHGTSNINRETSMKDEQKNKMTNGFYRQKKITQRKEQAVKVHIN